MHQRKDRLWLETPGCLAGRRETFPHLQGVEEPRKLRLHQGSRCWEQRAGAAPGSSPGSGERGLWQINSHLRDGARGDALRSGPPREVRSEDPS